MRREQHRPVWRRVTMLVEIESYARRYTGRPTAGDVIVRGDSRTVEISLLKMEGAATPDNGAAPFEFLPGHADTRVRQPLQRLLDAVAADHRGDVAVLAASVFQQR